jgi:hypothetical protein
MPPFAVAKYYYYRDPLPLLSGVITPAPSLTPVSKFPQQSSSEEDFSFIFILLFGITLVSALPLLLKSNGWKKDQQQPKNKKMRNPSYTSNYYRFISHPIYLPLVPIGCRVHTNMLCIQAMDFPNRRQPTCSWLDLLRGEEIIIHFLLAIFIMLMIVLTSILNKLLG